ncbi:ESCRT-III subunit protein did4 [Balamuthia mandrillaris]
MSFWLFGRQKTPKEILREHQRTLRRAIRDIDRERTNLERQQQKLTIDIKKMAKEGQMGAAKIMAKDLVRTRQHITKFYKLRSHLQAVSLRIQTLQSTQAMSDAMKGASQAMTMMNRRMNIPAMQRVLQNFEMQSEQMDMKQEMMGDAMDDLFEEDDEEEQMDDIINQVLDEIGINLSAELVDTPGSGVGVQQAKAKTAAVLTEGSSAPPPPRNNNNNNNNNNNKSGGSGGNGGGGAGGGGGMGAPSSSSASGSDVTDDELQARLDALKRM